MNSTNTNSYMKVLEAFTRDELYQISQVKRFFECYEGDACFRAAINSGDISNDLQDRMKQIGIEFNIREMSLLWENPKAINEFVIQTEGSSWPDNPALLKDYPLLQLWLKFSHRRKMQNREVCMHRFPDTNSSKYEKWRKRRIASAESELGGFNHYIDHPTLAIELADGCGIQCWFCSFSAKKLKSVLDYQENKEFFRDIVRTCTDIFGKAAGLALLYYATEPHDNPHYIDYMRDFADITGSDVCTSTAACTNKKWIDELVSYYRPKHLPWPRLSVLSTEMLHRIHNNHTPWELMHVNMIMQMKDSERDKVSGGRIFEKKDDMRERDSANYLQDIVPQGTIACVSGFYINLIRKDIKLISPCYTSPKWPLGYRIFDEASFNTVEDFRRTLIDMIDRNMPETPPPDMLLRLRDDLVCRTQDNGFDLVSPNQIHHFRNKSVFKALGGLLTGSPISFSDAANKLVEQYEQNPFEVQAVLSNLFREGFLDETGLRMIEASGND